VAAIQNGVISVSAILRQPEMWPPQMQAQATGSAASWIWVMAGHGLMHFLGQPISAQSFCEQSVRQRKARCEPALFMSVKAALSSWIATILPAGESRSFPAQLAADDLIWSRHWAWGGSTRDSQRVGLANRSFSSMKSRYDLPD